MTNTLPIKIVSWLVFILLSLGSSFSNSASALPLFAKKYHLPCTACHEAFPKLNDVGIAFRDNGYQMGTERDTPAENPVVSPFSLRTTPIFTVQTQTGFPTDQSNSESISTGTFNLTGLDFLSGGVLSKDISYLLVIAPFLDADVDMEAAWIRFSNLFGSSWFNIKIGKHELDIPFSQKRAFGLTNSGSKYLVYDYHPGGSANINTFDLGSNQYGLEFMGHSKDSRIRYVIDLNNGSQAAGNQAQGKRPNLYTHFSFGLDQETTSERVGLFGDYGYWPGLNSSKTINGTPIPGTGSNYKPFSRIGTDLFLNLGSSGTPLASLSFQYLYGIDDGSLIDPTSCPTLSPPVVCFLPVTPSTGGSQDAIFHGGTVELHWMPNLKIVLFSHYDWISNKQQADISLPDDYNDQRNFVLGIRYYLHQSPFALIALHGEWGYLNTSKTNLITGEDQVTQIFLTGVDYAF
ncbi:MAG: hypothetical protein HY036_01990 [Nitrospirae bacterium]|nr:hypothetical protein [Nitrospirota bacterium]MBI3351328.1 hypothetical protein [Nitrospirota bacterium]